MISLHTNTTKIPAKVLAERGAIITKVDGTAFTWKVEFPQNGEVGSITGWWLAEESDNDFLQNLNLKITENFLSVQFERTRKFAGKDAALQRARSCIAGLTLGRKFGETFKAFLERDESARKMYNFAELYIKELTGEDC